jgi:acetylglutamate kinase
MALLQPTEKAEVLIEALGYLRRFRHQTVVIKLGGSTMDAPEAVRTLLEDVVFLQTAGLRPVVVHGGGKAIDRRVAESGLPTRKVMGRRYTDESTLAIVTDLLRNETNAQLVKSIRELGGHAVGLHTGPLQSLFGDTLKLVDGSGQTVDLGRVGAVDRVDKALIGDFCLGGVIPVIPSLAHDEQGRWLNVNADTAAAAVAAALEAVKLVFLTDIPGVLRDRDDASSLIQSLRGAQCRQLMAEGVIVGGMIPKVEACLEALERGVRKTHMVDGRRHHALLLEIFTEAGVGTEILPD